MEGTNGVNKEPTQVRLVSQEGQYHMNNLTGEKRFNSIKGFLN